LPTKAFHRNRSGQLTFLRDSGPLQHCLFSFSAIRVGIKFEEATMMFKSLALAAAALAVAQFISPSAKSDTLNVHGAINYGSEGPSFYTDTVPFNLPVAFTNATFTINSYVADDSSVAVLNGTELSNTGIFGRDPGSFPLMAPLQIRTLSSMETVQRPMRRLATPFHF
jgi:hypothetical protein